MKKVIFSAMRPTGRLHLGHLVGALNNWIKLQNEYKCIFGIVDWHALMGEYEQSNEIYSNTIEMAIDWIACGIDPEKSTILIQSHVPEHLELFMFFYTQYILFLHLCTNHRHFLFFPAQRRCNN